MKRLSKQAINKLVSMVVMAEFFSALLSQTSPNWVESDFGDKSALILYSSTSGFLQAYSSEHI